MATKTSKPRGKRRKTARSTARAPRVRKAQRDPQRNPGSDLLPLLNELLTEFYDSSISDLSRALSTTRDTVRVWQEAIPEKPRKRVIQQVVLLHRLCKSAEPYMKSRTEVGQWTLAPNPALQGSTPADALAAQGMRVYVRLINGLADYVPAQPDLEVELDANDLMAGIAATQGEETATQVKAISEARELEVDDDDLKDLEGLENEDWDSLEPGPGDREVLPNPERGGWDILKPGHSRASAHVAKKDEAEKRALDMARRAGGGDVRVYDSIGNLVSAWEIKLSKRDLVPASSPEYRSDTKDARVVKRRIGQKKKANE